MHRSRSYSKYDTHQLRSLHQDYPYGPRTSIRAMFRTLFLSNPYSVACSAGVFHWKCAIWVLGNGLEQENAGSLLLIFARCMGRVPSLSLLERASANSWVHWKGSAQKCHQWLKDSLADGIPSTSLISTGFVLQRETGSGAGHQFI